MSRSKFSFSWGTYAAGCLSTLALIGGAVALRGQEAPAPSTAPSDASRALVGAALAEQIAKEVRSIVERSRSAICRVEGTDEHGQLQGTGFFVDADGTLLTSYSVGGQSEDLVVTVGEEKFPAVRRGADSRSGLAVLKIESREPVPFLKSGKAAELGLGSPVLAVGYPMELALSPSFGLVAGSDLKFKRKYFATRHLRANLVVQRGQGGSPVLNFKGEAVGVLISTVEEGSGVFALPMEAANKVLHDLQEHGRVRQGWLGADVRITDAPEFGSSARIRALQPDGPGHRGGLRTGDVLLRIGERAIGNPEDVLDASFYISADEPLKVVVARAGRRHELMLTPGDPPVGEGPAAEPQGPAILGMEFSPKSKR